MIIVFMQHLVTAKQFYSGQCVVDGKNRDVNFGFSRGRIDIALLGQAVMVIIVILFRTKIPQKSRNDMIS